MIKIAYTSTNTGSHEFTAENLARGELDISNAMIAETLSVDSFSFDLYDRIPDGGYFKVSDGGYFKTSDNLKVTVAGTWVSVDWTNYTYGDPILFYNNNNLIGKFFLKSVTRVAKQQYQFDCVSAIGLLANMQHKGGMYVGATVSSVVADIMGSIPYTIDTEIGNALCYGHLPIASCRDNLQQVMFSLGASVMKTSTGVLHITYNIPDEPIAIADSRIYIGGTKSYLTQATTVTVSEHSYFDSSSADEEVLYDNTGSSASAADGDYITFEEPIQISTLRSDPSGGITWDATDINCNYAKITGTGVLYGKPYVHAVRDISKTNTSATSEENDVTVSEATLVSTLNSNNVLERVYSYYTQADEINCGIVVDESIRAGNLIYFTEPYGTSVSGYIKSTDMTLSNNVLKADCVIASNWRPNHLGNNYNSCEVKTADGEWTIPTGVTSVKVVIVGGGNAGYSGYSGGSGHGKDGQSGNALGGDGGEGGEGGKIYSQVLTVTPGEEISFTIGAGGTGVSGNHVAGGQGSPSTATYDGTTYTSANGTSLDGGVMNVITGTVYGAKCSESGIAGGTRGSSITYNDVTYTTGSSGSDVDGGGGGSGGGPAVGANGSNGGNAYYEWWSSEEPQVPHGGDGGAGATPIANTYVQTMYGGGGAGGHGGGGGGNGGYAGYLVQYGDGGAGGTGGAGSSGASGVVLIYY